MNANEAKILSNEMFDKKVEEYMDYFEAEIKDACEHGFSDKTIRIPCWEMNRKMVKSLKLIFKNLGFKIKVYKLYSVAFGHNYYFDISW